MMTRGMGDWFDPNCDTPGSVPGQAACGVPHWYCYIPGMATPDCLASLGNGLTQIGSAVGTAAAGTVNAAGQGAGGVLSGLFSGSGSGTLLLIAGIGLFLLFESNVLTPKRR